MGKATYQLNKPFQFMGRSYNDSLSLVKAFLAHWDIAISVFRRGDMQDFWTEYITEGENGAGEFFAEAYDAMWKEIEREDVLFQKVIRYIEPNLGGIPLIPAGETSARLYDFHDFACWLGRLVDSRQRLDIRKKLEQFNAEEYNLIWLDAAIKEGVLSAYKPSLKEFEDAFDSANGEERIMLCKKMQGDLDGFAFFRYKDNWYTSLIELLKQELKEKDASGVFAFFGEFYQSEALKELEKWNKKLNERLNKDLKENPNEKWNRDDFEQERMLFEALNASWETLDTLMAKRQNKNWYCSFTIPQKESTYFYTSSLSVLECNQAKKEEHVKSFIRSVNNKMQNVKSLSPCILEQMRLLKILKNNQLYDGDDIAKLEKLYSNCRSVEENGNREIKRFESILPIVVSQDYVANINHDMARRELFKLAIWPTEDMSESYIEEFFTELRKMMQKQSEMKEKNSDFVRDAGYLLYDMCIMIKQLEDVAEKDKRRVNDLSVLDYYVEKLDWHGGLCKKIGVDKTWFDKKPEDICNRYGIRLAEQIKQQQQAMQGIQEKLRKLKDLHKVNSSVFRFGGNGLVANPNSYDEQYKRWQNETKPYKAAIERFNELDDSINKELEKQINNMLKGEVPLGDIIERHNQSYKKAQELLKKQEELCWEYGAKLPSLRKNVDDRRKELDAAWQVERNKVLEKQAEEAEAAEKKRKKQAEKEKRLQKKKEAEREKNTKKWKKSQKAHERRMRKADRKKNRKEARKKFFGKVVKVITFPFKIYLLPIMLWRRSKLACIIALALMPLLVLLFLRYASPTYYGTKMYLGDDMRYSHYKVADGVTVIKPDTFSDNKWMVSVELPESLKEIQNSAFSNCYSLQEITIPASVESIGNSAFSYCKSLEKVVIRSENLQLNGNVFYHCLLLTDIQNAGNHADFDALLYGNVEGCRNLDRSDVYDNLYRDIHKESPLLENEVQIRNVLDGVWLTDNTTGESIIFDAGTDVLENIQISEEQRLENSRSVSFTCTLLKDFVEYDVSGILQSPIDRNSQWSYVDKSFACENRRMRTDRMEELQQQFAEGNYTGLESLLDNRSFTVGEEQISFGEGQVTVEQAQVVPLFETEVNDEGEAILPEAPAYRIAIKATVDKKINDYTFLGNILLSEKYNYIPQIITNMSEWNGMNLLGTYLASDGNELTIDCQYDDVYTVTCNGQKMMLVWDASGKSGTMISADEANNYSLVPINMSASEDTLIYNGAIYFEKVSDDVTAPDEEFQNPLVGVWEGTYDTSRSHVASRRYIFPAGGNYLTVLSKFGPTAQTPDFQSGATVDALIWKEEYNGGVIESRAWLYQPKGYGFVIFEGNLNESGTVMSGGGQYPFTMTKTEPDNASYSYGTHNGENWGIYDSEGNPWSTLFAVGDHIPLDALRFGDSYYKFYTDASTWEDARDICEGRGGHLAIIDSGEENAFLHSYFVKYGYERCYFGLSDAAEEGNWKWIDGKGVKSRYSNWNVAQPDSSNVWEDYGEFWNKYTDGTWNDCTYYEGSGYICEWE